MRLFVLGARAESSLPREVWYQLAHVFPRASFHLVFVGPEAMKGREAEYPLPARTAVNPFGAVVERVSYNMKISTYVDYFHTLHAAGAFAPYDAYFDCFVLFHPGLGHPGSAAEWEHTLPQLLQTKLPVLATGYTEHDLARDVDWVAQRCRGEFDVLLEPGENRFKSLRWDINESLSPPPVLSGAAVLVWIGADCWAVRTRPTSRRATGASGRSAASATRPLRAKPPPTHSSRSRSRSRQS